MAHTKLVSPTSWDFGTRITERVKVAHSGLRGDDLAAFTKRAAHIFNDDMERVIDSLSPGEELIHLIALGATEMYNPNRNGDGFKSAACIKYHPTFVKHARLYRDHVNRDPKKSYGRVKASAYHPVMHRVDLLVSLFTTKEAADKNGGLIADREVERLENNEDIPTSMSCSVPLDVCSGCGNKARNRSEYCGPSQCVKYGGVRHNLGHLFEDGHILHVDNPDPKFFDISHIDQHGHGRGADRIAYVLGKAAAEGGQCIGGAELAEQWNVRTPVLLDTPPALMTKFAQDQLKIAARLVELESRMYSEKIAGVACVGHTYDGELPVVNGSQTKLASVLAALADVRSLLPVSAFLGLVTSPAKAASVLPMVVNALPGVHEKLAACDNYITQLQHNPYRPGTPTRDTHTWAVATRTNFGITLDVAQKRAALMVMRGTERSPLQKTASGDAAEKLAQEYALYQLAFLASCTDDPNLPLYETQVVRNNFYGEL